MGHYIVRVTKQAKKYPDGNKRLKSEFDELFLK